MANALAWVSQSAAPSYIIQQDFESAGVPSGWTNFGGCTFHNTSSPLEGTGDLKIVGGAFSAGTCTLSPTVSEYWMVALIKCVALPSSGADKWFGTDTSGFANCSTTFISSAGVVQCWNGSGSLGAMASSVVGGTLYYLKHHYKVGTGANSISSFELSTTGTWINSGSFYVSTTTGISTSNAGLIALRYPTDGECRLDHVRMSATDLGNSFSNWP